MFAFASCALFVCVCVDGVLLRKVDHVGDLV